MKKTTVLLLSLALVLLASVVSAFGQDRQPTFDRQMTPQSAMAITPQGPVSNNFTFLTSEFSFDKLVKGAPYSAEAVTETTQTLGDGNRIVNTSSSAVYRDGEGRTRRESTLKAIGPFASSGEPMKTISIYDPVAGVAYILNPVSREAQKTQAMHMEPTPMSGARSRIVAPANGDSPKLATAASKDAQNFSFMRSSSGEMQIGGAVSTSGGEMKLRMSKPDPANVKREDLGTQTVEGVSATGNRTTITIPAGQIGNERAIEIIEESWFSPDLQTIVMTRHSDPRSGEVVFRLANINRIEPDHSLFEVPSDYTIREAQPMRFKFDVPAKPEM